MTTKTAASRPALPVPAAARPAPAPGQPAAPAALRTPAPTPAASCRACGSWSPPGSPAAPQAAAVAVTLTQTWARTARHWRAGSWPRRRRCCLSRRRLSAAWRWAAWGTPTASCCGAARCLGGGVAGMGRRQKMSRALCLESWACLAACCSHQRNALAAGRHAPAPVHASGTAPRSTLSSANTGHARRARWGPLGHAPLGRAAAALGPRVRLHHDARAAEQLAVLAMECLEHAGLVQVVHLWGGWVGWGDKRGNANQAADGLCEWAPWRPRDRGWSCTR
jgi:hypothetical protein